MVLLDHFAPPEEYPSQLPEFGSDEEASEFFDAHSVAPYLDAMEEITAEVTVRRKRASAETTAAARNGPQKRR